jgi:hypothetical protein
MSRGAAAPSMSSKLVKNPGTHLSDPPPFILKLSLLARPSGSVRFPYSLPAVPLRPPVAVLCLVPFLSTQTSIVLSSATQSSDPCAH